MATNEVVQRLVDRICVSPVPLALFRKERGGRLYVGVCRQGSGLYQRSMQLIPDQLIGVYDVEVDFKSLSDDLELMGV